MNCPLVNLNFQYVVVFLKPQSAYCRQSESRTIFQFSDRRFFRTAAGLPACVPARFSF